MYKFMRRLFLFASAAVCVYAQNNAFLECSAKASVLQQDLRKLAAVYRVDEKPASGDATRKAVMDRLGP